MAQSDYHKTITQQKMGTEIRQLYKNTERLLQRLSHSYKAFLRNPYRNYFHPDSVKNVKDPLIHEFRNILIRQIEMVIKPDVQQSSDVMRNFIKNLRQFA